MLLSWGGQGLPALALLKCLSAHLPPLRLGGKHRPLGPSRGPIEASPSLRARPSLQICLVNTSGGFKITFLLPLRGRWSRQAQRQGSQAGLDLPHPPGPASGPAPPPLVPPPWFLLSLCCGGLSPAALRLTLAGLSGIRGRTPQGSGRRKRQGFRERMRWPRTITPARG